MIHWLLETVQAQIVTLVLFSGDSRVFSTLRLLPCYQAFLSLFIISRARRHDEHRVPSYDTTRLQCMHSFSATHRIPDCTCSQLTLLVARQTSPVCMYAHTHTRAVDIMTPWGSLKLPQQTAELVSYVPALLRLLGDVLCVCSDNHPGTAYSCTIGESLGWAN